MILRVDARGPGSDQISYRIGNHPDRQLIRREAEALGRLWFPQYEEERSSFILHVRSNIPPIPDRLRSPSIRYREWHRFPEWIKSFLGKAIRETDPVPEGGETPEYRVKIGVLPDPIQLDDTLIDLFDRVDFELVESSGKDGVIHRWLRLRTEELTFSGVLRRLAILVPGLFGVHRTDLETKGYADLLETLRGTWFNLHPWKGFLTNRFLAFQESATGKNPGGEALSIGRQRTLYQQHRELFDRLGERISNIVEIPLTAEDQEMWVVNARDGMILPELDQLTDEFSIHLIEGSQNELQRLRQRVQLLNTTGTLESDLDADQIHWCPAGFRFPRLHDANVILWSPRHGELSGDMIQEVSHEMLSVYAPDRLVTWVFSGEGSVFVPDVERVRDEPSGLPVDESSWRSTWERKAREKGYDDQWHELEFSETIGRSEKAIIGRFTK